MVYLKTFGLAKNFCNLKLMFKYKVHDLFGGGSKNVYFQGCGKWSMHWLFEPPVHQDLKDYWEAVHPACFWGPKFSQSNFKFNFFQFCWNVLTCMYKRHKTMLGEQQSRDLPVKG